MSNKNIPPEDLNEWHNYLNNSQNFSIDQNESSENKKAQGELTLDLHGFTLEKSYKHLEKIFLIAKQENVEYLLIITGIGKYKNQQYGKLHDEIPKWLETTKFKKYIKSFAREKHNEGVIRVKLLT